MGSGGCTNILGTDCPAVPGRRWACCKDCRFGFAALAALPAIDWARKTTEPVFRNLSTALPSVGWIVKERCKGSIGLLHSAPVYRKTSGAK